jgi:hypothetical protein
MRHADDRKGADAREQGRGRRLLLVALIRIELPHLPAARPSGPRPRQAPDAEALCWQLGGLPNYRALVAPCYDGGCGHLCMLGALVAAGRARTDGV